jgi:hypothetical protein
VNRLAKRLAKLEERTVYTKKLHFQMCYYGDPEPANDNPLGLVLWLHRPGCDRPGHAGACALPSPEEH